MHKQYIRVDKIAMQGWDMQVTCLLHKQNVNLSVTGELRESSGLLTLAAAEDAECVRRCRGLQRAFWWGSEPNKGRGLTQKYTTPKTKHTQGYFRGMFFNLSSVQLYLILRGRAAVGNHHVFLTNWTNTDLTTPTYQVLLCYCPSFPVIREKALLWSNMTQLYLFFVRNMWQESHLHYIGK